MRARSVFPFLPLFLFALRVTGVSAGPITGHVADPDGRPVVNARVWISGTSMPVQTTTDSQGRFALTAPDSCRCEIRASADGFRAEPVALDGTADARDVGVITLSVSAISESLATWSLK